jgi:type I restriction enzyme S subunit
MRKLEENELKPSGVEWVGAIPLSWEMIRAGFVFKHLKEMAKTNSYKYDRLSLTMQGVLPKSKEDTKGLSPDNFDGYQIIKPNSLLFKLIDLANIATSRVGISSHEGIVSGAYVRLECSDSVIPKYAYYFYMDMYNRNIFNGLGSGVRSALNAKDLLKLSIPLPDLATQQRIAAFLDERTSKIDALVEEFAKFKTNLQLQKRSLVSECVTKGLPSERDIAYKDSGVEWLGEVSASWGIGRLKDVCKICNGADYRANAIESEEGYPVYGSNGVFAFSSKFMYDKESIIFGRKGTIDIPNLVNNPFWVSDTAFYTVTHDNIITKFLYYFATSIPYKMYGSKTALPSMTQSALHIVPIGIPPLDEQQRIADYLDTECAKIDDLIGEIDNQVNLLKTYRKSLINEVVTGKVEV